MDDAGFDLKIMRSGQVYAALPEATLRRWIAERRVLPDDLVRPVGAMNWLKVSLSPEFAQPAAGQAAARREPIAADARQRAAASAARASAASAAADAADDLGIVTPAKWRPRRRRRILEDTELDMTPMIDVTFQLLIFFMLANRLANAAPIEVPLASHGKGVTPDGKQSILVDEAGVYYLGQLARPDSAASLDEVAQEVAKNAGDADQPLEVIISAHKRSKYQSVRELLERLGDMPGLGPIHLGVEEQR
jgi:biopolymer transport protein ExbD